MSEEYIKKEYFKNRTRIQRFIRSAKKRGYSFPDNVLPPIPLKITEGSIRRLEKITPKKLYSVATFSENDITQQEKIKNLEDEIALKQKELEKAKQEVPINKPKDKGKMPNERFYENSDLEAGKGNEADEVDEGLDTLRQIIKSWTPSANWTNSLKDAKEADKNVATNVLDAAIAEKGLKQVIRNVQANGDALKELLNHVLYDSGSLEGNFKDGRTQVNADIKRFQELLLGHTLSQQEAMKTQELIERLHHFEEV